MGGVYPETNKYRKHDCKEQERNEVESHLREGNEGRPRSQARY